MWRKRSFRCIVGPGALAVLVTTACATATQRAPSPESRRPSAEQPQAASANADRASQGYTAADVDFIAGMIRHHAQAVLMAQWAPTHDASPAVRTVAERILVAQEDELALMQHWLGDRNEFVPDNEASDATTTHEGHDSMPMPGMLTEEQLAQLDAARGPEFDRLFLTFMIQHHLGAIAMVEELFSASGAAQDETVFQIASDVSADQTAEIERMTRMLANMSTGGN